DQNHREHRQFSDLQRRSFSCPLCASVRRPLRECARRDVVRLQFGVPPSIKEVRMKILLKMVLGAVIFSSISVSGLQQTLFAQVVEANLVGRVTDPSGAVMTGVTVAATSKSMGFSRKVSTDDRGNYVIRSLQPGVYEISAETPGFKK